MATVNSNIIAKCMYLQDLIPTLADLKMNKQTQWGLDLVDVLENVFELTAYLSKDCNKSR